MNREHWYRVSLTLLSVTLVLLSAAYEREYRRADMGERFFRTLTKTRSNMEIVERQRDDLKKENDSLREKAVIWHLAAEDARIPGMCANGKETLFRIADEKFPVSESDTVAAAPGIRKVMRDWDSEQAKQISTISLQH